jgi:hypothetical protein
MFDTTTDIFLEKGKGFPIGTIRVWNGNRYQKLQSGKWYYLGANKDEKFVLEEAYEETPDNVKRIEKNIKDQTYETLYAINDNGRVEFEINGDKKSVRVDDDSKILISGSILTHNHPSYTNGEERISSSLSQADVVLACKHNAKEIRAVAGDGKIYSMKPGDYEKWGTDEGVRHIRNHMNAAYQGVKDDYQQHIREMALKYGLESKEAKEALELAPAKAQRTLMRRVADTLGLEYNEYDIRDGDREKAGLGRAKNFTYRPS